MSRLTPPFNFLGWIDEHRHLLKPPVGNKCIVDDDFIVMIVGGPNQRTDFHVDEGPELFYQIEGDMVLRVQESGELRDIAIGAGQMFYLPARIPHSPQRSAGGVGLVVERRRLTHELDGLQWYCQNCNHLLYDERFPLLNIETDFGAVFDRFYRSAELRRCDLCDHMHPAPARYGD